MNKYLILIKDRNIILRLGVLGGVLVLLAVLNTAVGHQSKTLRRLRQEKELVMKIKPMTDKIRAHTSTQSKSLNVQGVVYQSDSSYALIDGNIYNVGDTVGNYKIVEIGHNSMTILHTGTGEQERFVFEDPAPVTQ